MNNSLPNCINSRRDGGFTLIEVIVSIAIMGMLSVAVLSASRTALLAWERGSEHLVELRRHRVAMEVLNDQIRGALPLLYLAGNEEPGRRVLAFEGTRTSLRFAARASFKDGPDAMPRWVALRWVPAAPADRQTSSGELLVEERRILPPDNAPDPAASWTGVVLHGESCSFDFLDHKQRGDPAKWMPEWDYATRQMLPRAVRMTCTSEMNTIRKVIPLDYAASSLAGFTLQ